MTISHDPLIDGFPLLKVTAVLNLVAIGTTEVQIYIFFICHVHVTKNPREMVDRAYCSGHGQCRDSDIRFFKPRGHVVKRTRDLVGRVPHRKSPPF